MMLRAGRTIATAPVPRREKERKMSHLLDRLNFLQPKELEQFSNGHGG